MVLIVEYTNDGTILQLIRATSSSFIERLHTDDQQYAVISKLPEEAKNMKINALRKAIRIKHINSNGTAEVELAKE